MCHMAVALREDTLGMARTESWMGGGVPNPVVLDSSLPYSVLSQLIAVFFFVFFNALNL